MTAKSILVIIVLVLTLAIIVLGLIIFTQNNKVTTVNSFEKCQAAGYPIMESYPEQCRTPDGRNFVKNIPPLKNNFGDPIKLSINKAIQFFDGLTIVLNKINDSRCKPEMVCIWAGELSPNFNVAGGNITNNFNVAGGNITNQGAEFNLGITTKKSTVINGYVFTLQEATETTATVVIAKEVKSSGTCYVGGCSGQVCSDQKDVITTCEYKQDYACYKTAKCERQTEGACAWTQTPELQTCLGAK